MDNLWNNQSLLDDGASFVPPQRPMGVFSDISTILFLFSLPFILNYSIVWALHQPVRQPDFLNNHQENFDTTYPQLPPIYPHLVPFLGNTLSFAFDSISFLKKAVRHDIPVRLSILGKEIFVFHSPEAVSAIWKHQSLGPSALVHSFKMKYIFGLTQSSKTHQDIHSQGLLKTLNGDLNTIHSQSFSHFQQKLSQQIPSSSEWSLIPDFLSFFQDTLGASIVETLYGPDLLRLNPHFLGDLWEFDGAVPKFARLFPRFFMPESYAARDRLLASIRKWKNLEEDDSTASADLNIIWASVTNLLPATLLSILHIYSHSSLLTQLRKSPDSAALLNSITSETLRLHLSTYLTHQYYPSSDSSPLELQIGKHLLPPNRISLIPTSLTHFNPKFWNEAKAPLHQFYAERFIINGQDQNSGPIKREMPTERQRGKVFTTEGLKGQFVPFGAGTGGCPGRFLAGRVMQGVLKELIEGFEIEVEERIEEKIEGWRFGLGVWNWGGRNWGRVGGRIRRRV
ncbi:cytochrome P450 [Podospora fimiseda]|uniref:Cytochrome P450 n=1 Tax=Podospora fimiseda TaxID=252190 RepID=A0AAN7BL28_9PEZI|nr:cytochrome P450 [Podospora fimiseda]